MARLISCRDLCASPWKNGGGSTTEIAIAPAGAGFDDFDWRVSLATIAQSGPFSTFFGIDRTLTLVSGAGVTLDIDGTRSFVLSEADPLIEFAGEDIVTATVNDGATTDFNVMTRRLRCMHHLERSRIAGEVMLMRRGLITMLFLADGDALSVQLAEPLQLMRYDAVVLDQHDAAELTLASATPAMVFIVDFFFSA